MFNLHPSQPDVNTHRGTLYTKTVNLMCSTCTPVNLMSTHTGAHYTNTVNLMCCSTCTPVNLMSTHTGVHYTTHSRPDDCVVLFNLRLRLTGVTYSSRSVGAPLCSSASTARASLSVCAEERYAAV